MNSQPERVHCTIVDTQSLWNAGLWQISFSAGQPEQGFRVVFRKWIGETHAENRGHLVLARILRKSQGRLEPGFVLEEFFPTADGRCLARFRHATEESFHLSVVVTVSLEEASSSDSTYESGGSSQAQPIAVLEAVLLMRTEAGQTRPRVVLLDQIDALSTEPLGQIRVRAENLRNSAIPLVPQNMVFGQSEGDIVFDVVTWRLPGNAWLLRWVHPLDGLPLDARELSELQINPVVRTVTGSPPEFCGYEILPGGIEKGVTFAARCLYIMGEGAVPKEGVTGRLQRFLLSQPPLSEG